MSVPRYALESNPRAALTISRRTFEELEDWMRDNAAAEKDFATGMNALVAMMAYTIKGAAQKKTMGVVDRRATNTALAYKIPVRRITGRLFAGWKVSRLGPARYMVYNDDRAAWVLEEDIDQRSGRRMRRPILKLSVMQMLKLIQTTRTAERMVDSVMKPRRNGKGQFQSFQARMAGTAMTGVIGPTGYLP